VAAIYRYEVPVDGQWHDLELTGTVLHVASRQPDAVEIWALQGCDAPTGHRYQVFGTGQPLPETAMAHVGTALAPGGLVWHLIEAMDSR
jgi:hypothetical protein